MLFKNIYKCYLKIYEIKGQGALKTSCWLMSGNFSQHSSMLTLPLHG